MIIFFYLALVRFPSTLKLTNRSLLPSLQVTAVRTGAPNSIDNDLQSSIRAAMMRMKKVATDSDEEDRGDEESRSADWES